MRVPRGATTWKGAVVPGGAGPLPAVGRRVRPGLRPARLAAAGLVGGNAAEPDRAVSARPGRRARGESLAAVRRGPCAGRRAPTAWPFGRGRPGAGHAPGGQRFGLPDEAVPQGSPSLADGLESLLDRDGDPLIDVPAQRCPPWLAASAHAAGAAFVTALPVPGMHGRAVLVVLNRFRSLFTGDDVRLLVDLGSHVAALVERQTLLAERATAEPTGWPRRSRRCAGQPGQERLPGQHEPRAAHAAQRDHRLQRADARRGARSATGVACRTSGSSTSTPAAATCWR